MIRDTWRAALVVVTAALLREIILLPRPAVPAATPAVATSWQPPPPAVATGWQQYPQPVVAWQAPAGVEPQRRGPLRNVARSVVDLAESVLEVVR